MTVLMEYGSSVRVVARGDWLILQQQKGGDWTDLRFFDRMSNDSAHTNAHDDAQRLAAKSEAAS